ncbi:hypothetical protein R6Q57_011230, partial [Mikania cordata]
MGFLNHRGGRKKEDATVLCLEFFAPALHLLQLSLVGGVDGEGKIAAIKVTKYHVMSFSNRSLLNQLLYDRLLQVGPLVQTCNFAVMTGVNAGISCVMKRLRGKEDVETSMVAAFRSGVMFSLVIDMEFRRSSPPHTKNFSYMTDNTYTKQEVVKMEADLLKALKYEMGNPTAKSFLRKITIVAQEDYHLLNNASVVIVDLAFYAQYAVGVLGLLFGRVKLIR